MELYIELYTKPEKDLCDELPLSLYDSAPGSTSLEGHTWM